MKKKRIKVCAVISTVLDDAFIPGIQIQLNSKAAESYGIFLETALSEEDAWDSCTTDPSETKFFDDMGDNHEF